MEVKKMFSNGSANTLRRQVEYGESECQVLVRAVAQIQKELSLVETEIEGFKLSRLFEDVQAQKHKDIRLSVELEELMQQYEMLRTELFALVEPRQSGVDADSATVEKLTRQLGNARRKHLGVCEKLIALKNRQMQEIEGLKGSLMSRNQSVLSLSSQSSMRCGSQVDVVDPAPRAGAPFATAEQYKTTANPSRQRKPSQ
jgi:hypothetical protein